MLDDIAKLENDLKFIMLPVADDAALSRSVALDDHLVEQADLLIPLGQPAAGLLADPAAARVDAGLSHACASSPPSCCARPASRAPCPRGGTWIAQLRYSAHTLTFVESDERQKRFALASTCRLADRLARSFSG